MDILDIYKKFYDNHYKIPKDSINAAHIFIKQHNNDYDYCVNDCIGNELAYMEEYDKAYMYNNVEIVYISDINYVGLASIIGIFLQTFYKNLHTIIFDIYRSGYDNIIGCESLNIRNLIITNMYSPCNAFKYAEKIPLIQSILFEDCEFYNDYTNESFLNEFNNCLKIAKNLKCVIFFVKIHMNPEIFDAPNGWSAHSCDLNNLSDYFWICYEKKY